MLFYLRNNLEADILGAAGGTVGLTLRSCAPVLSVSAAVWGPQRGFESKKRTLPSHSPSFAGGELFNSSLRLLPPPEAGFSKA